MKKLKVKCFQKFVKKAELSMETLVNEVSDMEAKVRFLDSNGYIQMILPDTSFIIYCVFLDLDHAYRMGE
jgi:hypothetical protein